MEQKNQTLNSPKKVTRPVVSLDEYKYRKQLRKEISRISDSKQTRKEFEITLIVVRYIFRYMPNKPESELDLCNYDLKLSEIFKGNRDLFAAVFFEILAYWEIEEPEIGKYLQDNEFKLFPTIESICTYVENKIAVTTHN